MTPGLPPALAWPFLVAAGRRRDYTTVLAPDFLVGERDYGALPEVVGPTARGADPAVAHLRTVGGRHLTLVSTTHPLTHADLADPGEPARAGDGPARDGPVRDEHGRPLRLVYGFAYPACVHVRPAPADLDAAWRPALDAYRHFLADEDGFTVVASAPFPMRSAVAPRGDAVGRSAHPVRSAEPARRAAPPVARGATRTRPVLLGGLALVLALAATLVLGVVSALTGGRAGTPPASCPSATLPPPDSAPPTAPPTAVVSRTRAVPGGPGSAPSLGASHARSAAPGTSPRTPAGAVSASCAPRPPG